MPASNPEGDFLRHINHPSTTDCPVDECSVCGERDCPHGEPLHYHHDGCPACETEALRWQVALDAIRKLQYAANGLSYPNFCSTLDWPMNDYSRAKWQDFQQVGILGRFDGYVLRKLWEMQP